MYVLKRYYRAPETVAEEAKSPVAAPASNSRTRTESGATSPAAPVAAPSSTKAAPVSNKAGSDAAAAAPAASAAKPAPAPAPSPVVEVNLLDAAVFANVTAVRRRSPLLRSTLFARSELIGVV